MAPDATRLEVLNEVARIATLDLELRPMLRGGWGAPAPRTTLC